MARVCSNSSTSNNCIRDTAETLKPGTWFYDPSSGPGLFGNPRDRLLTDAEGQENAKSLVATIIRDPRFDRLDWNSLNEFVWVIRRWLEEISSATISKVKRDLRTIEFERLHWPNPVVAFARRSLSGYPRTLLLFPVLRSIIPFDYRANRK
jgi:hypothetical protein